MPTNVTGTLVDKNGQVWALATVQFIFQPAVDSKDKYTLAGSPFDPGVPTTSANGGGVFNITVPASSEIKPENSQWMIVITPNATSQAMVYKISTIPGTLDLTTLFAAVAELKLIQSVPLPRAYNDAEMAIPPNPGQLYYDTTSKQVKFFENNIWNPLAGGGTGGMIYPPAGIPVSTGSSWAASINPSQLVTYPTPGLAVSNSTSTGWDLSIDPATLQRVINLTTNGNSGPATLVGTTLNIPQYAGAAGGMVYPAAGVAVSDGAQWLASIPPARVAYVDVSNTFAPDQHFTNSIYAAGNAFITGNIIGNGLITADRLDGFVRAGFAYDNPASIGGVAGQTLKRIVMSVNGQAGVSYSGEFSFDTQSSLDLNPNNDILALRHRSGGATVQDPLLTINGVGDLYVGSNLSAGRQLSWGVQQPITPATARTYGGYIYNDATALNVSVFLASADGGGRGAIYLGGIGPPNLPTKNYAYFGDGGSSITDNLRVSNSVYIGNSSAPTPRYAGDGFSLILDPTTSGGVYFNWYGGSGNVHFGNGAGVETAYFTPVGNLNLIGGVTAGADIVAAGSLRAGGLAGPYLTWDGGSSFLEGKPNGRLLINQLSGPSSFLGVTGFLQVNGSMGVTTNLNTSTLQINGGGINGYVLMGNGVSYVPQPLPLRAPVVAVPSGPLNSVRALDVVYLNSSGYAMIVSGWALTRNGGTVGSVACYIGTASPPLQPVYGGNATATIQNGAIGFYMIVPAGWYYQVKANTIQPVFGTDVFACGCWVETLLT